MIMFMYKEACMKEYKLICVTNRHLINGTLSEQLVKIFKNYSKPDILILREKNLKENEYKILAKEVMQLCSDNHVTCILHLFKDIAISVGADGIHLPFAAFSDMSANEKKQFKIIGVSVHSKEEAVNAQRLGASYIIAGHIFKTECKKGVMPRGLAFLGEICNMVSIPVYAIGGINERNTELCIEAGAAGVCMMSGFMCI